MAQEILCEEVGSVLEIGHREVVFLPSGPGALDLRVADDVFAVAATAPDPGSARESVAALADLAAGLDAAELLDYRRDSGGGTGFGGGVEVSASFLGRRNFSRYDIEDAVGGALARRFGVEYRSRREAVPPAGYSGWRVTLDGSRARLLLRIADRPLHRRSYKRRTIPGTLHPPLAAAMARLAEIRSGERVLDPCCGAGTLLIEAAHLCPDASYRGLDRDPEAVRAARANATGGIEVGPGDAGALSMIDASVDRVLCNPAWGGQVPPRGRLAGDPRRLWREMRRVLVPGGTAVVLIPDTTALASAIAAGLVPVHVQQVRVAGKQAHIARFLAG
ncbi:23S rRNA G2445 N2-methylase RlmL [Nocardia transvalensis]|uniref:23S rRNA G2445 N2-methylase RlmL n=1 Tax=Nocardia transvalensis TaxID=37333 RepID=A0A7W9P9G9_9NOCA|nr:methyltransferase domain-containing protein [Nocardia transvalensis]MBB5911977.1 23S rRNA G2445 N2-methylase RlmL [Nocardia transvalensis]